MTPLIERAVAQFSLLEPGEKVLACVSGGADSVSLLHWLRFCSGHETAACHLNHGLRGEESLRDEEFVRRLCAGWGIPLIVKRADVAAEAKAKGFSIEEAGRKLRYAFFEEARVQVGAAKTATAHTLSDNLETMLFRLGRGSGLPGLCGIPPKRGNIIRPLLLCSREEVERYCAQNGLEYVTDSTNLSPSYTRNRIRLEAVPALRAACPGLEAASARTAEILREENAFLEEAAGRAWTECLCPEGLSLGRLAAVPLALRRRVLARFLRENGMEESFDSVERLRALAENGSGRTSLPGGAAAAGHGFLYAEKPPVPPFAAPLPLPGSVLLPDGRRFCAALFPINLEIMPQKVYKNLLYLCLDYDKINGKIIVRQKEPGDRASIAGRGGGKTLKKLFSGAGMNARQRSEAAVFADETGVAAVWGFGPDIRCAVGPGTKTILKISLSAPGKSDD